MPKFKYTAVGQDGKIYRGIMQAINKDALYQQLKAQNKFLKEEKEVVAKGGGNKLSVVVIADFCRQLGTLLGAGVSLVRALTIISNAESIKPNIKYVYDGLLTHIRQGVALSDAMSLMDPAFPELLINMFRSAEASGTLDSTAKRMAAHFEKEHRINSKVKSAMVYPIILVVMMIAIVIFVVGFILPQFADLFETMGELPMLTQIVMGMSDVITNYWYVLIIVAILIFLVIKIILGIANVRKAFDKLKLRLPIVGKLLRTIYTARFARTLSSLYGSGVPIIYSVQTAARTVGNKFIEAQVEASLQMLQQGQSLAETIRTIQGFEIKLSSSILVGEESGNLDEMLEITADSYDYESEMAINRLVTLLEPCMLIIMGVMVCTIMLAVLLPIFGSYNAIEQSGTVY